MNNEHTNCMLLKGFRGRECLTQKQLAELTGISVRSISRLENKQKPFTNDIINTLAMALNTKAYNFCSDEEIHFFFDNEKKATILRINCLRCLEACNFTLYVFICSFDFLSKLELECPHCKKKIALTHSRILGRSGL